MKKYKFWNTKIKNSLNKKLLIRLEKRKRAQVYNTIDYSLNLSNFMDFYSKDLISVLNNAQIWAKLRANLPKGQIAEIKAEDILYSFLLTETNLQKILEQYHLNHNSLFKFLTYNVKSKSSTFPIFPIFSKFTNFLKKTPLTKRKWKKTVIEWKEKPQFSAEIAEIFQRSILNAVHRFKTPVITAEIFFITLMESKALKASHAIKLVLSNEVNWYKLRYKLFKNLYFDENHMRNNIIINQRHFGYILKSRLSELEFSRLIDLDLLGLGVEYFRNKLFKKSLKINILDEVKKDVLYSAKYHKREYSSNKASLKSYKENKFTRKI